LGGDTFPLETNPLVDGCWMLDDGCLMRGFGCLGYLYIIGSAIFFYQTCFRGKPENTNEEKKCFPAKGKSFLKKLFY